jgi:hypothetical protein
MKKEQARERMESPDFIMGTVTFNNKNRVSPVSRRMLYLLLIDAANRNQLPGILFFETKQGADLPYIVMKVKPRTPQDNQTLITLQHKYVQAINAWGDDGYPKFKKIDDFRKRYLRKKK